MAILSPVPTERNELLALSPSVQNRLRNQCYLSHLHLLCPQIYLNFTKVSRTSADTPDRFNTDRFAKSTIWVVFIIREIIVCYSSRLNSLGRTSPTRTFLRNFEERSSR